MTGLVCANWQTYAKDTKRNRKVEELYRGKEHRNPEAEMEGQPQFLSLFNNAERQALQDPQGC